MQGTNRKKKILKIFRIMFIVLCSLILVLGGTSYFLLHGYISKLNMVKPEKNGTEVVDETVGKVAETDEEGPLLLENSDVDSAEASEASVTSSLSIPNYQSTLASYYASLYGKSNSEADQGVGLSDESSELIKYLNIIRENITSDNMTLENSKVKNFLLIGSDSRDMKSRGRSDTMILVTLNKEEKEITATSFLRDIYLEIPGKGANRLNAAYAMGGAELLMDTLEKNFKIKLDQYIKVDFFTFIDIIDALGGISLTVSKDEIKVMNGYITELNALLSEEKNKDILNKEGTYLLNGKQVLAYTRNRYTANGDFDRTNRQREILQAIYDKVYKLTPLQMNEMLNTILPQITTNLTEVEIIKELISMPSYLDYKVKQLGIPVSGSYRNLRVRGMAVLGVDFNENITEIKKQLYHLE